jgi:LmbE family N-acetylglucosaminyl deacetylase
MRMLLLAAIFCTLGFAQPPYRTSIAPESYIQELPANRGSAALWQSLKKLHTRASLMMITAHPDDEDGGMLAYESRGQGVRVSLLTLNRGEGGANVMSPHFFDALGLVRTMELLDAGRYYGVEQYFTRVIDYGFSKTKAESIKQWTHDRVLADVVRLVRMNRPLVITSVFVGGPSDGHGNHETAGAMAQEVFDAAGDPTIFPEQISQGLKPWSPLKQYAHTPWFGGTESRLSASVTVPEGTYDPVLGASYAQIAREGLGHQKTQNGGGSLAKAGPVAGAYHRFHSRIDVPENENTFFDGIDISLAGIATLAAGSDVDFLVRELARINAAVEDTISKFSASEPARCAAPLAAGLKETMVLLAQVNDSALPDRAKYDVRRELEIKIAQFNNALAESLGVALEATVTPEQEPNPLYAMFMGDPETSRIAVPGQTVAVHLHVANPTGAPALLKQVATDPASWVTGGMTPRRGTEGDPVFDFKFTVKVPEDSGYTRPYFVRPGIEQSYYDIVDDRFLGNPLPPYPLAARAEFEFEGVPVRIEQYVQTVQRATGLGSVYEPLVVGPPISVAISPHAGIVPLDAKPFPVSVQLQSNVKGPAKGTVRLDLPPDWTAAPPKASFEIAGEGEKRTILFSVTPVNLAGKSYRITAVAEYGGKQYREGYTTAGYPGLRTSYLYREAAYRTSGVDVKVAPGLQVGYVMGSGDDVPASLEHFGIRVTALSPADLASGDLSRFDTIILGVRVYAARDDVRTNNGRLLDYVKNGGVLIVQYNTPEYDKNYGPYPYTMGDDPEEVTDEASTVAILRPDNPVFQWPNRITSKDFEGWVEERGSKWMRSWDPRWEALLETHDEGQAPQNGGLLYAKYGKGIYIYNAYAFYRELPEGVPGAYRIFANMVSLARDPSNRVRHLALEEAIISKQWINRQSSP